jgi:hypothetical protein
MITIKTIKEDKHGRAEMTIAKGTPYTTMLLGCEMLIESLMKENTCKNIDDLLSDLKRIYIRDNGGTNEKEN